MVVQYLVKYKKNIAIDMRKRGFSYGDIEKRLSVPKSTLSFWLKNVPLDPEHAATLRERRLEKLRSATEERATRRFEAIRTIQTSSARDIGNISKRELWLIGIALYWRERFSSHREGDLSTGVRFSNSDPDLVALFLKWLQEIGNIPQDDIMLDLFLPGSKSDVKEKEGSVIIRSSPESEAIAYWAKATGFQKHFFSRVYFQSSGTSYRRSRTDQGSAQKKEAKSNPQAGRKIRSTKRAEFGFLRIRVKASSLLARQIAGWIRVIKNIL